MSLRNAYQFSDHLPGTSTTLPNAYGYSSAAYGGGAIYDLLSLDYGDGSQLTNYFGADGEIHACAHNLLVSSADMASARWIKISGASALSSNVLSLPSAGSTVAQQLYGGNNQYVAIAGEPLTASVTIEAVSVDTPGTLTPISFTSVEDGTVSHADATLNSPGDVTHAMLTNSFVGVTTPNIALGKAGTFRGTVRITNLCLSVGSETFPYITTGTAGAVYKYRLPEYLRAWDGSAYAANTIVEKNSGEEVNAVVEAVAVANALPNNQWEGAGSSGALSAGMPTGWVYGETGTFAAEGTVEIDDFAIQDGVMVLDLHVTGTFTGAASFYLQETGMVAAQNDVWSWGCSVSLANGKTTAGLSATDIVLQERAGGSFLTNHALSIPKSSLTGAVGGGVSDTFYSDTVTATELTTDNLYELIQPKFAAGEVDVIYRIAIPFATKTAWVPQPILTYGAAVTRTAEAPVSTDLAGRSSDGTCTLEAVIVTAPGTGPIDGAVATMWAAGGNYFGMIDGDYDGDGDSIVSVKAYDGSSSFNAMTSQTLASGSLVASVGSYNASLGTLPGASDDGTTQGSGEDTGVVLATPLDASAYLGSREGASDLHELMAIVSLTYTPNKALTEAEAVAQAALLIAEALPTP